MLSGTSLLAVEDLSISFTQFGVKSVAVNNLCFSLQAGKTVALVGESGSGKSVSTQAILGLLPPNASVDSGKILFTTEQSDTLDLNQLKPSGNTYRQLRKNYFSVIFQEPMTALSPVHTIGNQISEALSIIGSSTKKETKQECLHMLDKVGFEHPQRAYGQYSFELSGGMRQRAMIAMAMITKPAVLIADEPTTALDVTTQARILELLKTLQSESNTAILLITHDFGVVANMADDIVVMCQGDRIEAGTSTEILTDPQHNYVKSLIKAVPNIGAPCKATVTASSKPEKIIEIKNISKSFRVKNSLSRQSTQVKAVDNLSLDIFKGECLGLVGESGCGKSTLSKLLLRIIQPDNGEICYEYEGSKHNLAKLDKSGLQKLRSSVQLIFQDPYSSLNPRMTVKTLLTEPLQIRKSGTPASRLQKARQILQRVGLSADALNRYPNHFSGGQRQRIAIARALMVDPSILICDEPTSALDVSIQQQVIQLLQQLKTDYSMTSLFISHNLAVIKQIANRVAVMYKGRIIEIASTEELFTRPLHPYTKNLINAVPAINLNMPLDFNHIEETSNIHPDQWPPPYSTAQQDQMRLMKFNNKHWVLANQNTFSSVTALD